MCRTRSSRTGARLKGDAARACTAVCLGMLLASCEPEPTPPPASPATHAEDVTLAAARQALVTELAALDITDPRVLEVLGRVPRHEFVPLAYRSRSYENTALPIAENQTISPPYIVALMTQLLELTGGERVLEIGTGSGYQAAVLGELVGDGEVYTVEIRDTLQQKAKARLESLRERGILHYQKLETVVGDGAKGHPAAGPYDAIVVTAAPRRTPHALLSQLKVGGRMVIPVGDYTNQQLQLIRKRPDGTISEQVITPTLFVPLEPPGVQATRP